MSDNNIKVFFIGFMGCGKSIVGRTLAGYQGLSFYDQDRYIENMCDLSISDIFTQYGEPYFRNKEHQSLVYLSKHPVGIFSGGGGVVMQERNRLLLKKNFDVVFLDAPPQLLWERVKLSDRPLVQKGYDFFMNLFYERYALYKSVQDYTVIVRSFDDPWTIVNKVMAKLELS